MLEVDDIDDADIVDSLLDAHPSPGFQVTRLVRSPLSPDCLLSLQVISIHTPVGEDPGQSVTLCQTFAQVWRAKLPCTSRSELRRYWVYLLFLL